VLLAPELELEPERSQRVSRGRKSGRLPDVIPMPSSIYVHTPGSTCVSGLWVLVEVPCEERKGAEGTVSEGRTYR